MRTLSALAFAAFAMTSAAMGQGTEGRLPIEASLGIGAAFGGDVTFENAGGSEDVDHDSGFIMKLEGDLFPIKYFGFGAYLGFTASSLDVPRDDGMDLFEFGVAAKGRIPVLTDPVEFFITPGLYFGYRRTMFEADIDDADGLALNFGVDFRARFEKHFDVFIEPGFLTQPVGGNDDVDVTFGPIGYILFGVGYAF